MTSPAERAWRLRKLRNRIELAALVAFFTLVVGAPVFFEGGK
jgi:hypothetical protein